MRTIKFKGKSIDSSKWIEGYYYEECDIYTYITKDRQKKSMLNGNESVLVHPDTVCQFTGLLDKNGKEIYEGDVLRSDTYPYSCTEIKERDNYYGVIYWNCKDAAFNIMCIKNIKSSSDRIMSDGYSYSIFKDSLQDFEVIGNIHDPEWKQYRKCFQEAYK